MLQKFDERNRDLIVNINGDLVHRDKAGISPFDSAVQGGDAPECPRDRGQDVGSRVRPRRPGPGQAPRRRVPRAAGQPGRDPRLR